MGREYVALARGDVARGGTVDAPIGRHPTQRTRWRSCARGKAARTHYEVVERFGDATLLRCRLETGRTHQIRVHLASIGHPLVGDPAYGGAARSRSARQALHAAKLSLVHPVTGAARSWTSPLPADFAALLAELARAQRAGRRRGRSMSGDPATALAARFAADGLDWIVPAWAAPTTVRAFFTTRRGGVSIGATASLDVGGATRATRPTRTAIARTAAASRASCRPSRSTRAGARHRGGGDRRRERGRRARGAAGRRRAGHPRRRACRWRSASPTACRCCSPIARAPSSPPRTRAGAGSPPACSRRRSPRWTPRRRGSSRGSARRSARPRSRWARKCGGVRRRRPRAACISRRTRGDRLLADLPGLARRRLARVGVDNVAGGGWCTVAEAERFHSWRRDRSPGRMAALVWRDAPPDAGARPPDGAGPVDVPAERAL